MKFPNNLDDAFVFVADEWNKAEEAVKLAEQVNYGIINPAVYELRYAGRRLVEALAAAKSDKDVALELVKDAHFDCCRARHDAIDAATSYMAEVIEMATKELGADVILDKFPKVTEITHLLNQVRKKIAESRRDRDNRDLIYESIQADNLTTIVPLYEEFKSSEPLLIEAAQKNRKDLLWARIQGWGGVAIGIISLLYTVFFA